MKHNWVVIGWMTVLFLAAQGIGLVVLQNYIDVGASVSEGKTVFRGLELAGIPVERPPLKETSSFLYLMLALIVGTSIMLLLIKWQVRWLWKVWFAAAITICLGLSLAAFIPSTWALLIAGAVSVWKILRPNWFVQTFSELFMYAGLAVIFVPVMNLVSGIMLLLLISAYDAYAVWKSKHMIALATFQAKERMFAGLLLPYQGKKIRIGFPQNFHSHVREKQERVTHVHAPRGAGDSGLKTAILGGGDIGFPLMFAGIVLKSWGLLPAVIIPFFAAAALVVLFLQGEDGKFYPAMPMISIGCLVGLGVASLL